MRKPIRILGRVLLTCIAVLMLIALISIVLGVQSSARAQALPPTQKTMRSSPQSVDRVVAVVNHEVITACELDERIALVKYRFHQQQSLIKQKSPTPPPSAFALPTQDKLQKQVLEYLVLQRVQLQKAKEEGISSTDEAAKQALEKLAQGEKLSLAAYRQQLEKAGLSWSAIQSEIIEELTLEALRQKEVERKVIVSEIDVDRYMANPTSNEELAQFAKHSLGGESVSPRTLARQLIAMRRAEQAYAVWLNELRDSATIRYTLSHSPTASE